MAKLLTCLLVLASLAVLTSACSDGDTNTGERDQALKSAIVFAGDDPNEDPPVGETYDCAINPIRQPASPSPTLRTVRGTCRWDISEQGNGWLVVFKETWFCQDWSATAAGYPDCDGITGFHTWEYLVDLKAGTVDQIGEEGQFAPDM